MSSNGEDIIRETFEKLGDAIGVQMQIPDAMIANLGAVLQAQIDLLAELQSAGRLVPTGGMALTAEQMEDVRTAREALRGYRNFDGTARSHVNRLVEAVDALFPATEPTEEVKPVHPKPDVGDWGYGGGAAVYAPEVRGKTREELLSEKVEQLQDQVKHLSGVAVNAAEHGIKAPSGSLKPCGYCHSTEATLLHACTNCGAMTSDPWSHPAPAEPAEDIESLIERSSLGTESTQDAIDSVSPEHGRRVARMAAQRGKVDEPRITSEGGKRWHLTETEYVEFDAAGDIWINMGPHIKDARKAAAALLAAAEAEDDAMEAAMQGEYPPTPAEPAEERRSFPTIQDVPNNTLFHTHGGNGSSLFVRTHSGDLRLCLNAGPEWSKLLRDEDFLPSFGPYVEVPWSKFPQPPADPFAQPAPAEPAEEETKAETVRTHTPAHHNPETGRTSITVQRSCNRCGRNLGDATEKELDACVSGAPLPDVHEECGCASSSVVPAPTETEWQTWEAVSEGVTVKSANGEMFRKAGVDAIHLLTNGVGDCCKILAVTDLLPAPFVAAEEG